MVIETFSVEETRAMARHMAQDACPGAAYALVGGLGAGKTAFAQGFAQGLGVSARVTSPTFGLIHEYHGGRLPLYHFDAYRAKNAGELADAGAEDYLYGDGVCLVEWAEVARALLPEGAVWVTIEPDAARGADYRRITVIE